MVSKTLTITNKVGIHARPASKLVAEAAKFPCDITVTKGEESASAKSIIRLLRLRAQMGDTITVTCSGADEEKALSELTALIENKFGEE